jgi:hypothetical protein
LQARAEARTVTNNVLAVAQATNLLLEEALWAFLALDQWKLRRALSVQAQKIEGEEDKLIRAAFWSRLNTGTPSAASSAR